ncbi:MAG: ComF family protein [bacterium]|nr:ComF family protein [bacterium]
MNLLLDLLFPITCLGCKTHGTWVCVACESTLRFLENDRCAWCKRTASGHGSICSYCAKKTRISSVVCAFSYEDPLVKKVVRGLKYEFLEGVSGWMGDRLVDAWNRHGVAPHSKDVIVIPIPLHQRKFRARGFNQAELLARQFCKQTDTNLSPSVLQRVKATKSQTELAKEERLQNMKKAFSVCNADIIKEKDILLIDDVYTTGATLHEAAAALHDAGARTISALVFAKGL